MAQILVPRYVCVLLLLISVAAGRMSLDDSPYPLTDALLREVVAKMGEATNDYLNIPPEQSVSLPEGEEDSIINRVAKEYESIDRPPIPLDDSPLLDTQETMLRDQEYLQHSSLWGHQYVAGGAGEGKQRLKPNGSVKNVQQVKTDNVLPAYCNPPNPCPVGYTYEDGCTENFINTAAYSREYQASQECMCDSEHMFDCPGSSRNSEINALAQSIQNQGGDIMDSTFNKLLEDMNIQEHKTMAKKHHVKKEYNPYLTGDKLPVVAKKVPHLAEG